VTLTDVGCYIWYQRRRLPDWAKAFKKPSEIIFKTFTKKHFSKEKFYERHIPQSHMHYLLILSLSLFSLSFSP